MTQPIINRQVLLTGMMLACGSIVPQTAFCEFNEKQQIPTHREINAIKLNLGSDGKLETIAMNSAGHLLAAVSWPDKNAKPDPAAQRQKQPPAGRSRPGGRPGQGFRRGPGGGKRPPGGHGIEGPRVYAIKVISPSGRILRTWSLKNLAAKMIAPINDSTLLVGGKGNLALLDRNGKVQKQLVVKTILNGKYADSAISGFASSERFLFVAFGDGFSLRASEDIVRFNRDFSQPKIIIEQQHGCCAHLDLDVKDNMLLVAENSRFRVNRYDFDGKQIDTWGQRDRTSIEGFAACCNPVNFDFGPRGVLYTAESGIGRVKRFSSDGKFLGLAGYIDTTEYDKGSRLASMSCYIPIEVSEDGKRIYVMDVRAHIIRVLAQK